MFWSTRVREANKLDDTYIASVKASLLQLFNQSSLANWFNSVIAYIGRSLTWMDDPHLLSVSTSFQNVATWLISHNLGVIATTRPIQFTFSADLRVPASQHTDALALSLWGSQIAAELWVSEDPRDIQASIARFTIARRLNQQARCDEDDKSEQSISQSIVDLSMMADTELPDKGPSWFLNIGHAYRYEFPNVGALQLATSQYRTALTLSTGSTETARILYVLSDTLSMLFLQTGSANDINESIVCGESALEMLSHDESEWFACADSVGISLRRRAETTGSRDDLDRAIKTLRKATSIALADQNLNIADCQGNLCVVLAKRFEWRGDWADLDESIEIGRKSISHSAQHLNYARHLSSLGWAIQRRFESSWTSSEGEKRYKRTRHEDLDEMVNYAQKALSLTPESHPELAYYQYCLAIALWRKSDSEPKSIVDLEEAIRLQESAIKTTTVGNIELAKYLYNLCQMRVDIVNQREDIKVLSDAIAAAKEAVDLTSDTHSNWPLYATGLARALQARFERVGNINDLHEAIEWLTKTLNFTTSHASLSSVSSHRHALAVLLRMRYEELGSMDDLNGAISNAKISLAKDTHHGTLNMLGIAQMRRFDATGSLEDLEDAISNISKAIQLALSESRPADTAYHNLSLAMQSKHSNTNSLTDLDAAIEYARKATEMDTVDGSNCALYAMNLGTTLHHRFLVTRSVDDLIEAIACAQSAVERTPKEHPQFYHRWHLLHRLFASFEELRESVEQGTSEDVSEVN